MSFYTYILTNRPNGTLYVGVTNNLAARIYAHKCKRGSKFTTQYGLDKLVYYETYDTPGAAIWREKRLKTWKRAWKVRLILQMNPDWHDLYEELA